MRTNKIKMQKQFRVMENKFGNLMDKQIMAPNMHELQTFLTP